MAKLRGGIDLGGTKIQTAIVDTAGEVLGEARQPTPTDGGPVDVADEMAAALREAAEPAGVEPSELEGVGVGSPGDADEKTGVVSGARNLPGWKGSFPLGATLTTPSGRRSGSATTSRSRPKPSSSSVRRASSPACSASSGVPASAAAWSSTAKPWLGRGAAGEIGHMVVKRGGAKCPCGRKGCMEAYAGRGAMEAEARRQHSEGVKTDLFKLMEKHEKTASRAESGSAPSTTATTSPKS